MSIDFVYDKGDRGKCSSSRWSLHSYIPSKLSSIPRSRGREGICFHHQVEVLPASGIRPDQNSAAMKPIFLPRWLTSPDVQMKGASMLPCLWQLKGNSALWSISGLYATSGSGVCKAGKRKGLLWKEVDDGTTDVASHFFCVKCFLCCVLWAAVLSRLKDKELWSYREDFSESLQLVIG